MKFALAILFALSATVSAEPKMVPKGKKKEFKLYATLLEETQVQLSDGAVWLMDKGDVFPVEMYKEMQTKIVLQLAGARFMTDTVRTRLLKPEEVEAGLVNYRKNVQAYLESKSAKTRDELAKAEEEAKTQKEPDLPAR